MAKTRVSLPKIVSADEQLAEHLKQAEAHLIAAVELFSRKHKPHRTTAYLKRLTQAQELVTSLFREELVRMRGPLKTKVVIGKKSRRTR